MIRVLLVDDSPIALHILQRLLASSPEIEVVGTAGDGREALERLPRLGPDVICTDLHMPVMDGLEFTRRVMQQYPRPILVVSVSVEPGSPNVFKLLEAGAVDVYPKPKAIFDADQEKLARELTSKIRILAGVHVFRRGDQALRDAARPGPPLPPDVPLRVVVVGASTGGPQALRQILAGLPPNFPLPLLCVQHIAEGFVSELVAWLAEISPLPVTKAVHGDTPRPGVVYFAGGGTHLELDGQGRFDLTRGPPCEGHRPSVTITLRAAARRYGREAVGVLLSGMGRDGADGLADLAAAGGITIGQDEHSSVVYGMAGEAVKLGAVHYLLPLAQIAPALVALTKSRSSPERIALQKEEI